MKANAVVDLDRLRPQGAPGLHQGEPGRHLPRLHREQQVPRSSTTSCSRSPSPRASPSTTTTRTCSRPPGCEVRPGSAGCDLRRVQEGPGRRLPRRTPAGRPPSTGTHIANDASYIDAFIYANGGALLNNDKTKVRFNEAPGVEVFDMWGQHGQGRPGLRRPGPGLPDRLRQARRSPTSTSPAPGCTFIKDFDRGQGHRAGEVQVGHRPDPPEGRRQAADGHVRGQHHRLPHHPHQAGRLLGVDQVLHGHATRRCSGRSSPATCPPASRPPRART